MPSFSPSSATPRSMSPSLEQYIEAIAHLLTKEKVCSVSEIAAEVQVSRPAASRAVRELSDKELVDHKAYGYVDLTAAGQTIADMLTARHEALYNFIESVLGFDSDWADEEACRLEHLVGDELVTRMTALKEFMDKEDLYRENWKRYLVNFLG